MCQVSDALLRQIMRDIMEICMSTSKKWLVTINIVEGLSNEKYVHFGIYAG